MDLLAILLTSIIAYEVYQLLGESVTARKKAAKKKKYKQVIWRSTSR